MLKEVIKTNVPHTPLKIVCHRCLHGDTATGEQHMHNEVELLACFDGEKRIWVDNTLYVIHAGETAFINARIVHKTEDPPPVFDNVMLQFCPEDYSDKFSNSTLHHLSKFLYRSDNAIVIFPKGHPVFECIRNLKKDWENKGEFFETYLRGGMYYLLAELYRARVLYDSDKVLANGAIAKVMPALDYMEKNYGFNLSVGQLAKICSMSDGYFCRQFKEATGSTLIEYLNFVRVYEAEKLLRHTDLSVLEISFEVGFTNVSYFNRVFHRFKNASPTTYRKSHKSEPSFAKEL